MTFGPRYRSTTEPFPIYYAGTAREAILAERPWLVLDWPDLKDAFKPQYFCPTCIRPQYLPGYCGLCRDIYAATYQAPAWSSVLSGIVP